MDSKLMLSDDGVRALDEILLEYREYLKLSAEEDKSAPLPQGGLSRLEFARLVALKRAEKIRVAVARAVDALPILILPQELQRFHKDYSEICATDLDDLAAESETTMADHADR